jgi:hypothetical protein
MRIRKTSPDALQIFAELTHAKYCAANPLRDEKEAVAQNSNKLSGSEFEFLSLTGQLWDSCGLLS